MILFNEVYIFFTHLMIALKRKKNGTMSILAVQRNSKLKSHLFKFKYPELHRIMIPEKLNNMTFKLTISL